MRQTSDEGLALAVVVVTCLIAAVGYLSALPRSAVPSPITAANAKAKPAAIEPFARRPAQVALKVTVWPRGPGGGRMSWRIDCPPMTTACRTALRAQRALAADRPGPRPAAIKRGSAEAFVDGHVAGGAVAACLDRRDGCGVARWQAFAPLLARPALQTATRAIP